jgi:hypothetical protein
MNDDSHAGKNIHVDEDEEKEEWIEIEVVPKI